MTNPLRNAIGFAASCVAATFLLATRGAAHPEVPAPNWDHVAPVLAEHCVSCHRPGGHAALALDTYEAARWAASAIKRTVLDRSMPPWRAAPGFGEFANDASLAASEVELIAAWADGGARKGEGDRLEMAPPPLAAASPDLVLRGESQRIAGAHRSFELDAGNHRERWVRGWRFLPGNESLIVQAAISIAGRGPLGTWVPADGAVMLPEGVAYRLPARGTFAIDVRYRKTSREASDASGLALYFAPKPRRQAQHLWLPCGTTRMADGVRVLSVRPSLESFGDAVEIVARRPDGGIAPLGWFRNYPPNFLATYRYRHPVALPDTSVIDVRSGDHACSADIEFVVE
jgi:hypothetical protein